MAQEFTRRGPVPREGIAKASFFGEHETTFAHVRDALGDRFHVITGTIPYLGEAGGEVTLAGINKGSAIVQLIDQLVVAMVALRLVSGGEAVVIGLGRGGRCAGHPRRPLYGLLAQFRRRNRLRAVSRRLGRVAGGGRRR